jgi:glycolate oxidase FAD binding subunit
LPPDECLIDDFGPLPVVRPASVAELDEVVRRAAAEGRAIYPVGGGTMLGLGLPPTKPGIVVDVRSLDQVIDYAARDMTVTVQAGITIAKLQELLATENQRLPVDVPLADRATLGGSLAANVSGPRRFGWGTFRDYVIGLSAVNDEGQEVKGGGRVVKNVAGYDLPKLFVGSLGTLGIITQVTLKLRPRPEAQALVALGCGADAVGKLLDLLHGSRTRPVCVELLNNAAARLIAAPGGIPLPDTPWVIVVGFEETREAVRWQVDRLTEELRPAVEHGDVQLLPLPDPEAVWGQLVEFPAHPAARLTFKANLLPSATAAFCREVAARPDNLLLQAHAGSGIVIGHAAGDLTAEQARAMLTALQAVAVEAQGNLVLLRCPVEWKQTLPVWGVPRGDAALMRAVKEKLDPRRLFNPGRFVDGI